MSSNSTSQLSDRSGDGRRPPAWTSGSAFASASDDPNYGWKVLASVVVGVFMVVLDSTVINVALRTLQQRFQASTTDVQWVISLYTLVLGIATPLSGYLGDRFGLKRTFIAGIGLFVLGSAFCALAPTLPLLIAARGLQGLGGGIAVPLGTAMLFAAFPPQQRAQAFGFFGIAVVFAPAIGPLVGGWLVDQGLVSWIFLINLPIGLAGIFMATRFLRESRRDPRAPADITGIVLAPIAFGALLFTASLAGEPGVGFGDPRVQAGFAAGMLALMLLVVMELRSSHPLLDLRLYGILSFATGNVVSVVGAVALFGAEFLLPLYLQILRGRTALEAGLFLLPMAVAAGIMGPISGRIVDRIGPRLPIFTGFILLAFNTYQLSQIRMDTDLGFITLLVVVRGLAVALVSQNSQVAALSDVPRQRLTRATPLVNATRQTIQSLGVALLATILSSAVTVRLAPSAGADSIALQQFQAEYIMGLEHAYQFAFAVSIVALACSVFLKGWPGSWQRASEKQGGQQPIPAAAASMAGALGERR